MYGKKYEEFVNKFIRVKYVSEVQQNYDIETKTTLYEVKGAKVYHNRSFGRYYILIQNHRELLELSKQLKKIPKYAFVLNIDGRMIWKSLSWYIVNLAILRTKIHKKENKEYCYLSVKEIW